VVVVAVAAARDDVAVGGGVVAGAVVDVVVGGVVGGVVIVDVVVAVVADVGVLVELVAAGFATVSDVEGDDACGDVSRSVAPAGVLLSSSSCNPNCRSPSASFICCANLSLRAVSAFFVRLRRWRSELNCFRNSTSRAFFCTASDASADDVSMLSSISFFVAAIIAFNVDAKAVLTAALASSASTVRSPSCCESLSDRFALSNLPMLAADRSMSSADLSLSASRFLRTEFRLLLLSSSARSWARW